MMNRRLLHPALALVLAGSLAACGSSSKSSSTSPPTTAAATTAAAAATTAAPAATTAVPATTAAGGGDYSPSAGATDAASTTAAAASAAAGSSLALANDAKFGKIVVDAKGYSLYLFTKDTGTTSVCTGGCAKAWPPAVVTGTPTVGAGLDASKVATAAQPDGTMQLTYGGHLLYRFAGDTAPGQVNGQDSNGVWFLVDATGAQIGGAASTGATTTTAAAAATSLALATDPKFGQILVDAEGYSMYLYTKDTGTTTTCTGGCATAWPAATVSGTPTVGAGLDASKVGAAPQADGTTQLTYGGHLLYRFAKDTAPGQVNGQDVGGVWYLVNAAGEEIES